MIYRSCQGCAFAKARCEHRDTMRAALAGLDITSVRWRCKGRRPAFKIGEAVWALTVASISGGCDDDGTPYRDHYPGFVVDYRHTKVIVYIAPSASGRDYPKYKFEGSGGSGFCKLPLSRLSARHAEAEEICKACSQPASAGHALGWSCNPGPDGSDG